MWFAHLMLRNITITLFTGVILIFSDVEFIVEDATTAEYKEAEFDVIYSRDTILHIADKEALFANFYKWLKPGGVLMISDYCCTADEWHDDYSFGCALCN